MLVRWQNKEGKLLPLLLGLQQIELILISLPTTTPSCSNKICIWNRFSKKETYTHRSCFLCELNSGPIKKVKRERRRRRRVGGKKKKFCKHSANFYACAGCDKSHKAMPKQIQQKWNGMEMGAGCVCPQSARSQINLKDIWKSVFEYWRRANRQTVAACAYMYVYLHLYVSVSFWNSTLSWHTASEKGAKGVLEPPGHGIRVNVNVCTSM